MEKAMTTEMNRREFVEALAAGAATLRLVAHAPARAAAPGSSRQLVVPARVNPVLLHPDELRSKLDGEWQFRLDPQEKGLAEGWYANPGRFGDTVRVPGCWQGQGFGNEGFDEVWDFHFVTRTLRATYKGTGWYAKQFHFPAHWRGKRLWLNFGGVHPSAEVWLNGVWLGENDLPFVPFGFEVTDVARLGSPNVLTVRVHERNRQFGFAFNFQGNWSGLYRSVEATATGENSLDRLELYPEVERGRLRIKARVGGTLRLDAPLSLKVSLAPNAGDAPPETRTFALSSPEAEFEMSVSSPKLWSPDSPNLYRVDVILQRGGVTLDAQSERIGFVKLNTAGKHILINDEPYYLRGSGDFVSCPETGSPDTDRERWRRKLRTLRDYGYNYVRTQSYLYTPEYFDVADEVGLIVQSEMGVLGAFGGQSPRHVYQWPKPTPDNYPILKRQWNLSVMRDVNHPSANLYCMSNEYGKDTNFHRVAWQCYHDTKTLKPTALLIWTDGGYNPELPGDFVNWEAENDEKVDKPVIQHEFRWWSSFPDVRLMSRYNGAIRPYAAEMARRTAENLGQGHLLEAYADSSMHLQLIESKAKLEMCRNDHPRLAGICHFNAMDTNPSPQGVINEFYERKLADAATWRQTNGDTVVLCSLGFDDRVWVSGETRRCTLQVSDFGHPPFGAPSLEWNLVDANHSTLASGALKWTHEPFRTCKAGEINIPVPSIPQPQAARLAVRMMEGDRTVRNEWNVWLFPREAMEQGNCTIYGTPQYSWLKGMRDVAPIDPTRLVSGVPSLILTERLDEPLLAHMQKGGVVLLAATEGLVRPHPPNFGYGRYFFTPPANYPPYEDGQNGTVILSHAMLEGFPHEGCADLQFFRMIENAPPLDLEPFGFNDAEPVIRVIHRYMVCHPLAYLLERSVGSGRLIVCALQLDENWPEARYLLNTISRYARQSQKPRSPKASDEQLKGLMEALALS
jgi:hypothetical protein